MSLLVKNDGTISNCSATGTVTANLGSAGGLVGCNWLLGTISNSSATGTVTAYHYAGGFVGCNYATISNCSAAGTVTAANYASAGGLAGYNYAYAHHQQLFCSGDCDCRSFICRAVLLRATMKAPSATVMQRGMLLPVIVLPGVLLGLIQEGSTSATAPSATVMQRGMLLLVVVVFPAVLLVIIRAAP